MKPLEENSSVKTKTNSNFSVKLAEKSNHSFLLSIQTRIVGFLKLVDESKDEI